MGRKGSAVGAVTAEELARAAEKLTDDQRAALLQLMLVMQPQDAGQAESYDEANDPAIGLFSGPADLSARAKDILREEIDPRNGRTQKDHL